MRFKPAMKQILTLKQANLIHQTPDRHRLQAYQNSWNPTPIKKNRMLLIKIQKSSCFKLLLSLIYSRAQAGFLVSHIYKFVTFQSSEPHLKSVLWSDLDPEIFYPWCVGTFRSMTANKLQYSATLSNQVMLLPQHSTLRSFSNGKGEKKPVVTV